MRTNKHLKNEIVYINHNKEMIALGLANMTFQYLAHDYICTRNSGYCPSSLTIDQGDLVSYMQHNDIVLIMLTEAYEDSHGNDYSYLRHYAEVHKDQLELDDHNKSRLLEALYNNESGV